MTSICSGDSRATIRYISSRQVQKLSLGLPATSGEPGGALERVRMEVGHPRQHGAPRRSGAVGVGVGTNLGEDSGSSEISKRTTAPSLQAASTFSEIADIIRLTQCGFICTIRHADD